MDLSFLLFTVNTIIDFLKILLIFSIIGFILFKLFSPLRTWLEDKFSLSWIKTCLLLNFLTFFILILLVYVLYMVFGFLGAPLRDPETEYTLFENIGLVLVALPRFLIASIILSFSSLFFELVASFFMGAVPESKKKKRSWGKEVIGILVSAALFLIIFLFIFDWVPLGLFIYIFFGTIKPLPLLFLV